MAKKRPTDEADAEPRTSEAPTAPEASDSSSNSPQSTTRRRYTLVVQRQDAIEKPETRRTETFEVECEPQISVLGALLLAREASTGGTNQKAGSVAYEGDCFEGVCGACSMLINGRVALACAVSISHVADKHNRVRLAPMTRFPLVRDLVVDRSRISRTLSVVPFSGSRVPDSAVHNPSLSATRALELARLDQCHQCGACLEACPQYGMHSEFVGALLLHEVHRLNRTPGERHERVERLEATMAPGGVNSCGKAQNCVEVCPAELPLVDSIQSVARESSKHLLLGWLLH